MLFVLLIEVSKTVGLSKDINDIERASTSTNKNETLIICLNLLLELYFTRTPPYSNQIISLIYTLLK